MNKAVIVVDQGQQRLFVSEQRAALVLFGTEDVAQIQHLMLNPRPGMSAYYLKTEDYLEFLTQHNQNPYTV
jgi:hypothetical protein